MKVQIVRQYTDLQLNKNMNVGDVIEVTNERAKVLIDKDYAFAMDFETVEIEMPKKKRAKRK